jgi:hypothetical protein
MKHHSLVLHPNPQDVVLGKDKKAYHHPGNAAFRHLVQNHLCYYAEAQSRNARTKIAQDLCDAMKKNQSRFLKPRMGGGWVHLSEKLARSKVVHAFRDAFAHALALDVKKEGKMTTTPSTPRKSLAQNTPTKKRTPRHLKVHHHKSALAGPLDADSLSRPKPRPAKRLKQCTEVEEQKALLEIRGEERRRAKDKLGPFVQAEHQHHAIVDDYEPLTDFDSEGALQSAIDLYEGILLLTHPNVAPSEQGPVLLDLSCPEEPPPRPRSSMLESAKRPNNHETSTTSVSTTIPPLSASLVLLPPANVVTMPTSYPVELLDSDARMGTTTQEECWKNDDDARLKPAATAAEPRVLTHALHNLLEKWLNESDDE